MSFITRAAALCLMLAVVVGAQTDEEKYAAKLKKEFATKIAWQGTLDGAMKEASKGKKLIFGYFTRSYSP
jgi:hypothetical protein